MATGTLNVSCGEYTVRGTVGELPLIYDHYVQDADFHDDFGVLEAEGTVLVLAVDSHLRDRPRLLVSLRFDPGPISGFHPGVLLVPERDLLYLGAGTQLLAYDLQKPRRLWEDVADIGFWEWQLHGEVVVMAAEIELAAWRLGGEKLWSTFVEPPWEFEVRGSRLYLDVMGKKSNFELVEGP